MHTKSTEIGDQSEKKQELMSFLFLTIVLAPLIAVMVVGGYGLLIWIYQLIVGPPGPPGS